VREILLFEKLTKLKLLNKMSIICLVRHGDRLDTNNYEEWQNSPRYKENSHDTPLSELGFAEILKHKSHIPEVDYICTSPMTRCVQTALQLQSFLRPDPPENLVPYQ
jgi:broad specificity phosphatase PhoE